MQTKDFKVIAKAAGLGPRQIRTIVSSEQPDRVNDVLLVKGCDLSAYRKNPIVLADHDRCSPIGTAAVETRGARIEAVITFAPPGASAKADEYCALAKAGILNTASVGFVPVEYEPIKGSKGGMKIKQWELLEISLVSVPANPDAIVLQRSLASRQSVFGRTFSAKTTARERRNAAVSALKRGATTAAERAATVDRLRQKGIAPQPRDIVHAAHAIAGDIVADALARSAKLYKPELSEARRRADLEKLRR